MASRFEAAALVAAPSYPAAIAWSDENLIAVASGHLVTIINPALPSGPRGFITVPTSEPYSIGRISREDLLSSVMLPIALSRDRRPCVRSISWSPIGMAPNAGCLLAVCTTEGRVKLYRSPYCDFCAEWIEVMDLSDKLYRYLLDTNFGEPLSDEILERQECADYVLNSCSAKECKRRRVDAAIECTEDAETWHNELSNSRNDENVDVDSYQCAKKTPKRLPKKLGTRSDKPKKDAPMVSLITAEQYSSRNAHLSSLVIAWSPVLLSSVEEHEVPKSDPMNRFSVLAIGGKSGNISIWKITAPHYYSVENNRIPSSAKIVQLLQAHTSWATTIRFAVVGSSSNPQIVLASGSSDGSVKIWLWDSKRTVPCPANSIRFSLVKEVLSANPVPVSVVSLSVSSKSPHEILLAMGQGSGLFQVWTCNILDGVLNKVGTYKAHDYVVTDLVWAFDECCLYSCGQDNYIRGWILSNCSLCEVPLPANTPDIRTTTELPDVFLSCQGVAVSPGNLVLAVVRNLDVDHLNPMYQARTQRAVVEFFWMGGQKLDLEFNISSDCSHEVFPGFAANELFMWETNILWSLKRIEKLDGPLVLWDIIIALSSFKQSIPTYVDHLLFNWLSNTFLGAAMDLSVNKVFASIHCSLSKVPSRKLHLLNIISRRIILCEFRSDEINSGMDLEGLISAKGEQLALWLELLFSSERELRERLVGLSFSSFLSTISNSAKDSSGSGNLRAVGIAQMGQWVAISYNHIKNQIKELASEVGKHQRIQPCTFREEQCGYCSASVPFDSPDVALCRGSESVNGVIQNHKLARCAASMQVCPTTPVWLCKCCGRSLSILAPPALFTMPCFPEDFKPLAESCLAEEFVKPWCPFCGILLQRLQPDFLPSVSPV